MGPIWGVAFSYMFILAYYLTGSYEVLRIGAILCLCNLFNLLPVNPLDGGRILKSIAFSIHRNIGLLAILLMVPLAIYLSIRYHVYILYLVAFVCFLDYLSEKRKTYNDFEVEKILGTMGCKVVIEKPIKERMSVLKIFGYSFIVVLIILISASPSVKWGDHPNFKSNIEENIDK